MQFCPGGHGSYLAEAELCLDCGVALVPDRRGETIGDGWELRQLIGLGGMRCTVWEGARGEEVAAIKIAETDLEAQEARRLIHSASLVHGLEHPNIVRIFSYGETDEGEAHVVMELLRGRTLRSVLQQRNVLSVVQAVDITRQVLAALACVHDRGLVHRDVKPGNVHLGQRQGDTWEVRLIDFGVAKEIGERAPERIDLSDERPGSWGRIVGTPEYMAPEQVIGAHVDARADLYAVGVMLFRLVTGDLPFGGADRQELYEQQLRQLPPYPRAPEGHPPLPFELEAALVTALAKQPAERFQSATSFLQALAGLG